MSKLLVNPFIYRSISQSINQSNKQTIEDTKMRKYIYSRNKFVKNVYLHSGWLVRLVLVIDIPSNTHLNRDPTSCCLLILIFVHYHVVIVIAIVFFYPCTTNSVFFCLILLVLIFYDLFWISIICVCRTVMN